MDSSPPRPSLPHYLPWELLGIDPATSCKPSTMQRHPMSFSFSLRVVFLPNGLLFVALWFFQQMGNRAALRPSAQL